MKFNKALVSLLLALVMLMTVSSFALADEALKIGVIGPFTGAAAIYGNACRYGAQVAADEINAQGGLQIELLAEDDEHDPEKSVNAYNSVLDKGAQMIDGTTTTTPCIAVGAQANEDRVFMLTPSASSMDVVNGKDNVYQVCFTDPAQGTASAAYINEKALGTKIAIIYNNADAYSTGIYQTFVDEAATLGMEIVSETTFTDETTDFSVQVTAAKDADADLVFLPIYYTPASMILKTAKDMDYAPIFFGVDGMDGILTMEGFDASLAEGVFMLTPFAADADDERTQTFVASYGALTDGEIPNQFAADSYDVIYALYEASVAAGITGDTPYDEACELLIEQFKTLEVSGLTGNMTWSEDGTVTKIPTSVVIHDGAYVAYAD
ncbi:MAG: ABC transporter substrate-binding protein [Clostridia bacterium]|nr:ABC transporter substrate-binding protein [Clostridia bacterium]MBQ8971799.1 ABC transporter substrate-binding protein [Clostridia bacterium]